MRSKRIRDKMITIWVTQEEMEQIKRFAAVKELNVSQYLRKLAGLTYPEGAPSGTDRDATQAARKALSSASGRVGRAARPGHPVRPSRYGGHY